MVGAAAGAGARRLREGGCGCLFFPLKKFILLSRSLFELDCSLRKLTEWIGVWADMVLWKTSSTLRRQKGGEDISP